MAITIQLKRGTYQQIVNAVLAEGEPVFALDTKDILISDGQDVFYAGKVDIGTVAERPTSAPEGKLYYATDSGMLYLFNGTTWLNANPSNQESADHDLLINHINSTGEDHSFINQDVTTSAKPTFEQLIVNAQPVADNEVVTKGYLSNVISGLDWQESVIAYDVTDPSTLTPSEGERYLVPGGAIGEWAGHDDEIAEFRNGSWAFIVPDSGTVVPVEATGEMKLYNGTIWTKFGSVVSHNSLGTLQGGNGVDEYYHLTLQQYNEATQYANSSQNGLLKSIDFVKIPSQNEKDALAGTSGTPSATNKYVTNSDTRLSDARQPLNHASTHKHGGSDEIATATPSANAIPKADDNGTLNNWITVIDGGIL